MGYLIITARPDNAASTRTCRFAGCDFVGRIRLLSDDPLCRGGLRELCVYRKDLGPRPGLGPAGVENAHV